MTSSIQMIREFPLRAPLGGVRLMLGCEGAVGLPEEAFLKLYLLAPQGEVLLVRSLRDILARVEHCASAEEAWELLRLETSPASQFLFVDSPGLEVRVRDTLQATGDLLAPAAKRLGYREATLTTQADGFQVTRDLVRSNPPPCVLVRRQEFLSRDGAHSLRSETRLGTVQPAEVMLPDYE